MFPILLFNKRRKYFGIKNKAVYINELPLGGLISYVNGLIQYVKIIGCVLFLSFQINGIEHQYQQCSQYRIKFLHNFTLSAIFIIP